MQLAYIFKIVEKTSKTPSIKKRIKKHIKKQGKECYLFLAVLRTSDTRAKLAFLCVSGIWAQFWSVR